MRMKLFGMITIVILSISLLSSGAMTSFNAHASPVSMIIPSGFYDDQLLGMVSMISISMNELKDRYDVGDTITITGKIKDYNATRYLGNAITITISAPGSAFPLDVGQINQSGITSNGEYTYEFKVGKWKNSGNYTIKVAFDEVRYEDTFSFTSTESNTPDPVQEPDPEPKCGPGTKLVNDTCVVVEPDPPNCEAGTKLVDGECIPDVPPPPPPPCPEGTERVDGECVPVIPPPPPPPPAPVCGQGTELVDGICVPVKTPEPEPEPRGGGCLIATAAYGTELAPQVQFLREIRDNTVMSTTSGTAFMTGFNQLYYSFSPMIADMERSNPAFQQTVRAFITPMIASLSIMTLAQDGSEMDVLGLGISVIALNLGMYIVAPALVGITISRRIRSRRS